MADHDSGRTFETDRIASLSNEFSRPDYILAAIALVVAAGVLLSVASTASRVVAVGGSSLLALGLIGDALFHRPPQE